MSTNTVWNKSIPPKKRRNLLIRSTKGRNTKEKFLHITHKLRYIASQSHDRKTKLEARRDFDYFAKKYKKFAGK